MSGCGAGGGIGGSGAEGGSMWMVGGSSILGIESEGGKGCPAVAGFVVVVVGAGMVCCKVSSVFIGIKKLVRVSAINPGIGKAGQSEEPACRCLGTVLLQNL